MRRPTLSFGQLLAALAGLVLLGMFILYVLFQARFLLTGPVITLFSEPAVVQNERTITLAGTARNITNIWVNDRPIQTDELGNFSESIVLENGYTIISVSATDRYGRETRLERPFVFVPQSTL